MIDLTHADWFKSSYSQSGGACVEVAPGFPGVVPVRDSKTPAGPTLIISEGAWEAFVGVAKDAVA